MLSILICLHHLASHFDKLSPQFVYYSTFYSITPPVMLSLVCSFWRVIYWKPFSSRAICHRPVDSAISPLVCNLCELLINIDEGLTLLMTYGLSFIAMRLWTVKFVSCHQVLISKEEIFKKFSATNLSSQIKSAQSFQKVFVKGAQSVAFIRNYHFLFDDAALKLKLWRFWNQRRCKLRALIFCLSLRGRKFKRLCNQNLLVKALLQLRLLFRHRNIPWQM